MRPSLSYGDRVTVARWVGRMLDRAKYLVDLMRGNGY